MPKLHMHPAPFARLPWHGHRRSHMLVRHIADTSVPSSCAPIRCAPIRSAIRGFLPSSFRRHLPGIFFVLVAETKYLICAHTLLVYIGVSSQQEMRSFRGAGIHPLHYLLRAAYIASAVLSQPKYANIPDGCGPHCDVLHAKHTNPSTQFVREYISTVSFENWLLRFSTPHDLYVRQGLCAYPLYCLLGSTFVAILYSSATSQASQCIYRFGPGQCLPVLKQKQKQSGPWQITLAKNTRPLLIKEFVLPLLPFCFNLQPLLLQGLRLHTAT